MIETMEELERVRDECKAMVTTRSLASAAAAAVPLPGVDVAADIGLIVTLTSAINAKFGLSAAQVAALDAGTRQQVLVIVTSLGSSLIGKVVTKEIVVTLLRKVGVRLAARSVAKYIPIIGTAFATSVSFGAMKWLGNSHVDDCYETVRRLLAQRNGGAPIQA